MNAMVKFSEASYAPISVGPAAVAANSPVVSVAERCSQNEAWWTGAETLHREAREWDEWAAKVRSSYSMSIMLRIGAMASMIRYSMGPHPLFSIALVLSANGLSFLFTRLI